MRRKLNKSQETSDEEMYCEIKLSPVRYKYRALVYKGLYKYGCVKWLSWVVQA